jgi:phosphoglycerate dehydrogenase-like enzyme
MLGMTKPVLVVTSRYPKEVEDRIDRDYNARRNRDPFPFSTQSLLSATEGADALFITPAEMLLLLGASRRAYEAQEMVRTGAWKQPLGTDLLLGWQVGGKVLGILGMGRVGQSVARRARGFGMKIHYHDPSELPAEIVGAVYHEDPSELLRVSQFLSLHVPETPQTRHFLNSKAISLLPPGPSW